MLRAKKTIATPIPESGEYRRALVRRVLAVPAPILARRASEVDPSDERVGAIAEELVATLRASPSHGGLSAPQIGEAMRVIAIDVSGLEGARSCAGLVVIANPEIVVMRGSVVMRERCASFAHAAGEVARAAVVVVEGWEPGTRRFVRVCADALEARILQHEIDHLDGWMYFERMLESQSR